MILETGELATYDNVRRASWLALLAGARLHQDLDRQDLPGRHAAGHPRDAAGGPRLVRAQTGERRAVKPAGGIRTTKDAIRYLVAVQRGRRAGVAGPVPGSGSARPACSTTCCMQRRTQLDGHYSGPDYVTLD